MNTNEIKESAINLFWTSEKTLSDALDYAITEAQKENEGLKVTIRASALREAAEACRKLYAPYRGSGLATSPTGAADNCALAIESLITAPASECEWHEDGNGPWSTGCGGMFEITDGTPEQNKMKFCPYCGKPIAQVKGVGL